MSKGRRYLIECRQGYSEQIRENDGKMGNEKKWERNKSPSYSHSLLPALKSHFVNLIHAQTLAARPNTLTCQANSIVCGVVF